jgi:hypothetical protein
MYVTLRAYNRAGIVSVVQDFLKTDLLKPDE